MGEIKKIETVINEVKNQGFSIIENFWNEMLCSKGRFEIDNIISNCHLQTSKYSSDNRVFGIEHFSDTFQKDFINCNYVNNIMKVLYSSNKIYGTLLGQRVEGIPGNTGSGGSWHRDSIKKQYKAFLFISDIDSKSGPFQFFPKSNYFLNKLGPAYQEATDGISWIIAPEDDLIRAKVDISNIFSVICKQGTLLIADTSTIHRGKPELEKDRYSLTYYSFKNELPTHISEIVDKNKKIAATV